MFNYFIPGKSKAELLVAEKLELAAGGLGSSGLDKVLADVRRVPQEAAVLDVKTGPDGGPGCVIAPVRKYAGPPDIDYHPDFQDWSDGGTGYWLGVRRATGAASGNAESLSTKALERLTVVGGAEVTDEAGHVWTVPIGRAPHMGHPFGTLPQSYGFDAQGEPQPRLIAAYVWLWEIAGEIREFYLPDEKPEEGQPPPKPRERKPFTWLVKTAARILAVNYRLGPVELNWLADRGHPVLTSDTVHAIGQAAYGFEVLEETKKNSTLTDPANTPPAASSSSSTTGEKDATPGTAPAAEH